MTDRLTDERLAEMRAIAYTKPFEYKATARAGLAAAVETIKEQGCER